MKPAAIEYRAPERLEEVLELIADDEREARVIAGGQSLIPMMNMRLAVPEVLVDLRHVAELDYVRHDATSLAIGAGATQSQVLRDAAVAEGWPLLAAALREIAHPQVRNRGTVCGSIAHHDPSAELPAAALALDATMHIRSARGPRDVAAAEFFRSYFETALEEGELLAEVSFPRPRAGAGWSFRELARRRGDFALAGAAVMLLREDDVAADPRIVLLGVAERPVRCEGAESAVARGRIDGDSVRAAGESVVAEIDPGDDVHASGEYRRHLAGVLVERALLEAWERCG